RLLLRLGWCGRHLRIRMGRLHPAGPLDRALRAAAHTLSALLRRGDRGEGGERYLHGTLLPPAATSATSGVDPRDPSPDRGQSAATAADGKPPGAVLPVVDRRPDAGGQPPRAARTAGATQRHGTAYRRRLARDPRHGTLDDLGDAGVRRHR